MIRVGQHWTSRVAPSFGVEMQTQHKVRMQFEIHQRRTAPNLAIAVEQDFALPADGLLFLRISRIKNIGARLWHAIPNENLPGQLAKIIWTLAGRWPFNTSDKRNFRTEIAQPQG